MTLSLQKGQNLSLTKQAPGLVKIVAGLGWDARQTDGAEFDLDASLFMLLETEAVRSNRDFIFYSQKESACGAILHTGDNRTGEGEGDDEQIKIDLSKVPAEIKTLKITVTIHDGKLRGQNFGQVENAFIRLVDEMTGEEVTRFDLTEDMSTETAMVFGEIYRHGEEWKFRAIGQGYTGGLEKMVELFKVNLNEA